MLNGAFQDNGMRQKFQSPNRKNLYIFIPYTVQSNRLSIQTTNINQPFSVILGATLIIPVNGLEAAQRREQQCAQSQRRHIFRTNKTIKHSAWKLFIDEML